jgi:serine/threonine-protein kinase RsbW
MPKLELRSDPSLSAPATTVLALSGGLDLGSVKALEAHLEQLKDQGRFQIVVDLQELAFISSSGLGAFLGTVNHFRRGGGDLVFVKLSPKIQKVFSMVGFMRVLTVLPSLEEGLAYFEGGRKAGAPTAFQLKVQRQQPHSGEPFLLVVQAVDASKQASQTYSGTASLKPTWGIVSPARIGPFVQGQWSGQVILTGPGEVSLKVEDQGLNGAQTLEVVEHKAPAVFPVKVECTGCRWPLQVADSDVVRCRECNEIMLVDRWAQAISLRQSGESAVPASQVFQMLMPADVNILSHLRTLVVGLLSEQGYAQGFVDDVELALDEALTNIVEHAYAYDASKNIGLRLSLEKDNACIVLHDKGKPFDPKGEAHELDLEAHLEQRRGGGLGRFLMAKLMDTLDYSSNAEGNTLMMVKRVVA